MKLKSLTFIFLLFLNSFNSQGQIGNFKEKFELPSEVQETSGLLFFDGKIITHNDSGDDANLYEIDSLSGNLLRTININNATNVDWEDITEDDNHIYIGDFGNNLGTRTDLKIYKILKSDYLNSNSVAAETITFSYEDQVDFTEPETHNFDAEAFAISDNSILIFTKNRGDLETNVYKIPKSIGNHSAIKVSSANIEGLITGATFNHGNFLLCGYDATLIPFLVHISFNRAPGDDIFSSGFLKTSLATTLGQGSQVEGITSFEIGKYYISREHFSTVIGGFNFNFPQKLYEFTDDRDFLLSTQKNDLGKLKITPNPTSGSIFINDEKEIHKVSIFNTLGKKVLELSSNHREIDLSSFSKGIYLIKIVFGNQMSVHRKIIKL